MSSGRFGVTYEEVVKAVSKLQKKKIKVTIESVRDELGTGSKTTIMQHLRELRGERSSSKDKDYALRKDMISLVRLMARLLNLEVK